MSTDQPANDDRLRTVRICDMSRQERPRERALENGVGALTDSELIALLLGGGLPGLSVTDLARQMLASTDNRLVALAKMAPRELMRRFRGVGQAKAVTLSAAFELGVRLQQAKEAEARSEVLEMRTPDDVYRYMRGRLELLDHEEFWVVMLSRSRRIKATHCVSRGGLASTVVDSRIIFRAAIDNFASSIVLVHNHPSGNANPSGEDDRLTRTLAQGARLLDMNVDDHIIITSTGYYSYADRGRIKDFT